MTAGVFLTWVLKTHPCLNDLLSKLSDHLVLFSCIMGAGTRLLRDPYHCAAAAVRAQYSSIVSHCHNMMMFKASLYTGLLMYSVLKHFETVSRSVIIAFHHQRALKRIDFIIKSLIN